MTISNNAQVNYTHVNTQMQQTSNLSQQATTPTDTVAFSEEAKQLAQENQHVHSQSGASKAWSQSTTSTQNTQQNTQTSSANLQSLLMKSILSPYNAESQNSSNLSLKV